MSRDAREIKRRLPGGYTATTFAGSGSWMFYAPDGTYLGEGRRKDYGFDRGRWEMWSDRPRHERPAAFSMAEFAQRLAEFKAAQKEVTA